MKGFGRLTALLLAVGTIVGPGLGALEVEQGRTKLVLHEGIGRFSLYYRDHPPEAPGSAYVPLFVDRDPRTSGLSVLVGNKILRLGDGGDFREQAEKTDQGARFTWQSNQLDVTQEFRLPSSRPDVVVIEISVTNKSAAPLSVGLRLCLDTYLGEAGLAHFRTDRQEEVSRELTLQPTDDVRYWVSAAPQGPAPGAQASQTADPAGLFCLASGAEVTVPDRVVFANWKRLSEASWSYETSQTRNFNLVPYSINDSAVCHYYDPAPLPPKATRKVVLVLGNLTGLAAAAVAATGVSATGVSATGVSATGVSATGAPPAAPAGAAKPQTLQEELQLLDSLLRTLEEYLAPGSAVSEDDVRLIRETLSGIKSRSARY